MHLSTQPAPPYPPFDWSTTPRSLKGVYGYKIRGGCGSSKACYLVNAAAASARAVSAEAKEVMGGGEGGGRVAVDKVPR